MGQDPTRGGRGDAQRLRRRRRALEALRAGERATGALDTPQRGPGGDISTYDNHPADLGTDTWQRGQSLGLSVDIATQVAEVDVALDRVAEGTYGRCEACGAEIPESRLEVLPEARRCVACQERLDAAPASHRGGRPAEEAVLSPPFGRTFHDGADDAGFDGEDAWQAVARYGTSNTPADVPEAPEYPRVVIDPTERHGAVEDVENVAADDPGDQAETYDVVEDDR